MWKKIFDKKVSSDKESDLKIFESQNPFHILSDNPEETVQNIVKRNWLKNTPKKSLKKCKKCNFKRRSCAVDFSNCKTFHRPCTSCNKLGHNPKSMQCKSRRKIKEVKQPKNQKPRKAPKKCTMNKDILQLLRNWIDQIEHTV